MQGAMLERELLKREIPLSQNHPARSENFERTHLFSSHFIDSKALYLHQFGQLPSITVLRNVDYEKAYGLLRREFSAQVVQEYHYAGINRNRKKEEREESIVLLQENIVLEMGDGYCEFYYTNPNGPLLRALISRLGTARGIRRSTPQEVHLITRGDYGLELTKLDVKRTKLNLSQYYDEDFLPVHETILKRLNQKGDKGIVLLHGLPGTGKTTYLRHLVGKIRKRVLFVPPDMASGIVNPDLVKLLIENPNSVLVIEDAENILLQRQPGSDSAVSNLLNMSDGLLSDMLNVQIVCTFNSSVSSIDPALLRKGRLIARYGFGKLPVSKAQALSDRLGHSQRILVPATLAEILHPLEKDETPERPPIGFRQAVQG